MSAKKVFGVRIDPEVLQQLKDTVVGLQQLNPAVTVGTFVEDAIQDAIQTAQDDHNNGQPWPHTPQPPRRGPRL